MFFTIDHTDLTHAHLKPENQDCFVWLEGKCGGGIGKQHAVLCTVFDGVSRNYGGRAIHIAAPIMGHTMGEIVTMALFDEDSSSVLESALVSALYKVNLALNEDPVLPVTTCSMFLTIGNQVIVANSGDSPCFVFSDGTLHSLFECHNAAGDSVLAGKMREEEAVCSDLQNKLTGALGGGRTIPRVHTVTFSLSGDTLILLGSDGAFANFTKDEIIELIRDYQWYPLEQVLDRNIQAAGLQTNDNQTLVLWRVDVE